MTEPSAPGPLQSTHLDSRGGRGWGRMFSWLWFQASLVHPGSTSQIHTALEIFPSRPPSPFNLRLLANISSPLCPLIHPSTPFHSFPMSGQRWARAGPAWGYFNQTAAPGQWGKKLLNVLWAAGSPEWKSKAVGSRKVPPPFSFRLFWSTPPPSSPLCWNPSQVRLDLEVQGHLAYS